MSSGDQIKGVLLVDFVRIVRSNRNLPWEEHLTKEDMELIEGKIMPSTWYPADVLERLGYAVFKLVGNGDLRTARAFGAFTIQDTFHRVYDTLLFREKDPIEIIKKFIMLRKQFIRFKDPGFDVLKLEIPGENSARVIFQLPEVTDYLEAYSHQIAGGLEKLLEMAGVNDFTVNILKIQSETEPATEIEITWSKP